MRRSLLFCTIVAALFLNTPLISAPVFQGADEVNGAGDVIGLWKSPTSPLSASNGGTGSSVLYPRCILTAAHVAEPLILKDGSTGYFSDIAHNGEPVYQYIENKRANPNYMDGTGLLGLDAGDDWGVVWMENRTGDPKYIALSHYSLLDMASIAPVKAQGDEMIAAGYGLSDDGVGSGSGRWGENLFDDLDLTHGAAWVMLPGWSAAGDKRNTCQGDSGGPLFEDAFGSDIVGINAAIHWADGTKKCSSVIKTYHTSVPHHFDDIMVAANSICHKSLHVLLDPPALGHHSILQIAGPDHDMTYMPAGDHYNNKITCNSQPQGFPMPVLDCSEALYHGEQITIFAIPAGEHEFVKWKATPGSENQVCPCTDPNVHPTNAEDNPVCTIPYDAMGKYNATTSIDYTSCTAEFDDAMGEQ